MQLSLLMSYVYDTRHAHLFVFATQKQKGLDSPKLV